MLYTLLSLFFKKKLKNSLYFSLLSFFLFSSFSLLLSSRYLSSSQVCLGLVRLLHYLSQSPLGSVALLDFQPRQFVMVEGELKLTDLDDATAKEPLCRTDEDCFLHFPLRNFSGRCTERGVCEGMNEMRNLYNAHR